MLKNANTQKESDGLLFPLIFDKTLNNYFNGVKLLVV